MPRWEGNTQQRLEQAALDLFAGRGYEATTVAQITGRAGLTERSFYRWFADKREVLFAGDELAGELLAALAAVPAGTAPLPALLAAFEAAPRVLRSRPFLRERAAVVAATPALQERELIKLEDLTGALAAALARRGIPGPEARLAAGIGMAVLRSATEDWVRSDDLDFPAALAASARRLGAITAAGPG